MQLLVKFSITIISCSSKFLNLIAYVASNMSLPVAMAKTRAARRMLFVAV